MSAQVRLRSGPCDWGHSQFAIIKAIYDVLDVTTIYPDVAQQPVIHGLERSGHLATLPSPHGSRDPTTNSAR